MMRKSVQQIRAAAYRFFRRLLFILPTAVLIGLLVAFFLWSLDALTVLRFAHPWLLYLLPAAGLLIHFIYQGVGRSSEKGNDLIIGEIARENGKIPARMAPVILATTLITHLFGGSAGREGTAVQIGGSIASFISKVLHVPKEDIRVLLIAGMAAGFGAVFGTPLAGAVFAVEVLAIGRIEYRAFLPALAAAVLGDLTVRFCRVAHTQYTIGHVESGSWFFGGHFHADAFLLIKVVPAAILFGFTAIVFARSVQLVKTGMLKLFKHKWLFPLAGGLLVILITTLLGKPDYLGLGVRPQYPGAVTITSAFSTGGADTWSWFWKTLYTAITLGSGFKGGEVTPLFYIGATLGNTLAGLLNTPAGLFAALGFIAVFAGATNTPLACSLMGIELFGATYGLYFFAACFIAWMFSGHRGIYSAQTVAVPKLLHRIFRGEKGNQKHNARRN